MSFDLNIIELAGPACVEASPASSQAYVPSMCDGADYFLQKKVWRIMDSCQLLISKYMTTVNSGVCAVVELLLKKSF